MPTSSACHKHTIKPDTIRRVQLLKPFLSPININKQKYKEKVQTIRSGQWLNQRSLMNHLSPSPHFSVCLCLQKPKEDINLDCLNPIMKHGGGSLIIWATISKNSIVLQNYLTRFMQRYKQCQLMVAQSIRMIRIHTVNVIQMKSHKSEVASWSNKGGDASGQHCH